jgi:uncharacterized membrane protein YadS
MQTASGQRVLDRNIARWAMLTAIASVGIKTDLKRIVEIPGQSVVLIVGETVFVAAFVLIGVLYIL